MSSTHQCNYDYSSDSSGDSGSDTPPGVSTGWGRQRGGRSMRLALSDLPCVHSRVITTNVEAF